MVAVVCAGRGRGDAAGAAGGGALRAHHALRPHLAVRLTPLAPPAALLAWFPVCPAWRALVVAVDGEAESGLVGVRRVQRAAIERLLEEASARLPQRTTSHTVAAAGCSM